MSSKSGPAPMDRADEVLTLANELGYWPSWRQTKRALKISSEHVTPLRNAAEPLWRGADTPNANMRNTSKAPVIIGRTPEETFSEAERAALWERAIREGEAHAARQRAKKNQRIEFPEEPFALALMGDTHVGGAGVDYASLKYDAETVRDTPGMYALFGGDGTNNWIVGKLQALQRNEIMSHSSSWRLFLDWLDTLGDSLVAVILGNHDLWAQKVAGFEPIARHLRGAACLYDENEIVFKLACGSLEQRWKVRHKWRYGSVYNPTHPQEVGWERGDDDFDVAVGFHTHNGTLVRPFIRHGRRRHAVQLGTYKVHDEFAREVGFPSPPTNGCGALVGHPDGRTWWFENLPSAAEFLGYLREKYVLE